MQLNGTQIEAGSNQVVKLGVGRLPSGTPISIKAHVFRALKPGPTVLLTAGVHGDEINGVEILRRSIHRGIFSTIEKGSVIVLPLVNVFGFINFSREVPDGKDVNRSFPGASKGSLASRVAYTISKKILPLIDWGVDFHTGGNSLFNYPQIRYSINHEFSRTLAEQFDPPVLLSSKPIGKSFRKYALSHDIPILVYEAGESTRLDGLGIDHGMKGLQNILKHHKILHGQASIGNAKHFERSIWQRAPKAGVFIWTKSSGQLVQKGEPLGLISDPHGDRIIKIKAAYTGFIIGHNNAPVINQGDALFHIALK